MTLERRPGVEVRRVDAARRIGAAEIDAALFPLERSVSELAVDAIPPLLCRLSALQGALAAQLLTRADNGAPPTLAEPDRLLSVEEAAAILNVTPQWLYRHPRLPFVRKLSRKAFRVSETGLRRWLAARKG